MAGGAVVAGAVEVALGEAGEAAAAAGAPEPDGAPVVSGAGVLPALSPALGEAAEAGVVLPSGGAAAVVGCVAP